MSNVEIAKLRGQVIALRPVYLNGLGDATEVYTKAGQQTVDKRSIRTVLKEYVSLWCLDIAALRQRYKEVSGSSLAIPLPLEPGHTLVPVKMRHPICRSDLAYGYIDLDSVSAIKEAPQGGQGRTLIHLGKLILPTVATVRHGRQCLDRGNRVAKAALQQSNQGSAITLAQQRQVLVELLRMQSQLSQALIELSEKKE